MSADQDEQLRLLLRQSLHDFNNALGLILGFAGLLVRDLQAARAGNPTLDGMLDKAQEILDAAVQGEAIAKKMGSLLRSGMAAASPAPTVQPAGEDAAPQPPPAAASAGAASGPPRILMVKSTLAAAQTLSQAFARQGWITESFHSGREALMALRSRPGEFSCLIADQSVAELGGPELITALKALDASVPCLLLLDPVQPLDRESAELAGADAFRQLPASAEEVVSAALNLIERSGRRRG